MGGTKIQATEKPIGDIFTDAYRFTVPRFQRPYAWTNDEAGEMLDDLLAASSTFPSPDKADPYFLGSIVLVKAEDSADAEIVDGQQRLTTLSLLLSVIREFTSEDIASSLGKRLFQHGDPIKQIVDQPRLRLRDLDHGFFEKNILSRSSASQLTSFAVEPLPDSQRNLILNARLFQDKLRRLSTDECTRLVQFVDRHTYLVVVSTQDFESAYRIFTVLNERGLNLTHTDILKAEIIGRIPEPDQDAYTTKWESEESDLGREDFADLFSHIRMVFGKTKARESILREFRASVLSKFKDGRRFIDDVMVPLSDAFETVKRAEYQSESGTDEINRLLRWLNLLDNTDWIPPAISYISRVDADAPDIQRFLTDLERLAASLFIRRIDVTRRIERYGRVLEQMEADPGAGLFSDSSPLQLDPTECVDTATRLQSEIYKITRVRLYVLLRLDSALADGGRIPDAPHITVEHVLPQSPPEDSVWRTWFTNEEREYWVHRLANLVLLSRRKNSEAANLDFEEKKRRYFLTKTQVAPFALTTHVLNSTSWTPSELEARQALLVSKLRDLWRLG